MSKVWSFQRWLIAFYGFLSVSYANASDQVQNQEMAKSKGKILVVMTNHSAYPTRSDKTGLWLTELTHFMMSLKLLAMTWILSVLKVELYHLMNVV